MRTRLQGLVTVRNQVHVKIQLKRVERFILRGIKSQMRLAYRQ